jgi:hypothetical protein
MKRARRYSTVLVALICIFALHLALRAQIEQPGKRQQRDATLPRDDAGAARAFSAITPVIRHARCMNCHSTGDFPRQGDNGRPHTMNVRRGFDGNGVAGVKCSTCHQEHNLAGVHTPPGAPDWHLPPANMPMIWEGLTDRQLCELLKDPKRNGNRTVEEIVEHLQTPLVLWGWHPGDGRAPVPGRFTEFISSAKVWAAKGAACPADERAFAPQSLRK